MSDSKLYIGNLSSRTDERYLKDAFTKYGRIVTVEMKRRYAFVDFQRKSDAEAAISSMDGKEFDGSKLIVEWTRGQARTGRARYPERSDYRIEVSNLPDRCHWSELKDHFRKAGEVVFGDVWGSKGVIEFKHKNDMEYALKELDGVRWKGYALELRRDRRRSSSRDRSGSRDRRRSSRRSYRSYSPDSRSRSRERDRDRDSRRRRSSRSPSRSRSPRNKTQRSPSKSRSHSPRSPSKEKRRDSKDKKKYDSRSPSPSKKAETRSPREKESSANPDSEKREKDRDEEEKEKKDDTAHPNDESPRESRKRENEDNDTDRDDRKRQRTD
eukprot:TRINITY_DN538_c0_g1_i5.p1 TRINITY_DN538_c0_g1~~TRINITY_DN538_c0_g1_i5.p1  ORF type:complete len:326 (+),score=19.64 TRINITY_DN538_c0_g1_i5:14-991(+)